MTLGPPRSLGNQEAVTLWMAAETNLLEQTWKKKTVF